VLKKNNTRRICIDYTNLNVACPKEEFVLPWIDQIINSTTGSKSLCLATTTATTRSRWPWHSASETPGPLTRGTCRNAWQAKLVVTYMSTLTTWLSSPIVRTRSTCRPRRDLGQPAHVESIYRSVWMLFASVQRIVVWSARWRNIFLVPVLALQFGTSGGGNSSAVHDKGIQRGRCAVYIAKIYSHSWRCY
jgi:hypothetical protein